MERRKMVSPVSGPGNQQRHGQLPVSSSFADLADFESRPGSGNQAADVRRPSTSLSTSLNSPMRGRLDSTTSSGGDAAPPSPFVRPFRASDPSLGVTSLLPLSSTGGRKHAALALLPLPAPRSPDHTHAPLDSGHRKLSALESANHSWLRILALASTFKTSRKQAAMAPAAGQNMALYASEVNAAKSRADMARAQLTSLAASLHALCVAHEQACSVVAGLTRTVAPKRLDDVLHLLDGLKAFELSDFLRLSARIRPGADPGGVAHASVSRVTPDPHPAGLGSLGGRTTGSPPLGGTLTASLGGGKAPPQTAPGRVVTGGLWSVGGTAPAITGSRRPSPPGGRVASPPRAHTDIKNKSQAEFRVRDKVKSKWAAASDTARQASRVGLIEGYDAAGAGAMRHNKPLHPLPVVIRGRPLTAPEGFPTRGIEPHFVQLEKKVPAMMMMPGEGGGAGALREGLKSKAGKKRVAAGITGFWMGRNWLGVRKMPPWDDASFDELLKKGEALMRRRGSTTRAAAAAGPKSAKEAAAKLLSPRPSPAVTLTLAEGGTTATDPAPPSPAPGGVMLDLPPPTHIHIADGPGGASLRVSGSSPRSSRLSVSPPTTPAPGRRESTVVSSPRRRLSVADALAMESTGAAGQFTWASVRGGTDDPPLTGLFNASAVLADGGAESLYLAACEWLDVRPVPRACDKLDELSVAMAAAPAPAAHFTLGVPAPPLSPGARLTRLTLSSCGLGYGHALDGVPAALLAAATVIRALAPLQSLSLADNGLDGWGVGAIVAALQGAYMDGMRLLQLDLSRNDVGDAGASALAAWLGRGGGPRAEKAEATAARLAAADKAMYRAILGGSTGRGNDALAAALSAVAVTSVVGSNRGRAESLTATPSPVKPGAVPTPATPRVVGTPRHPAGGAASLREAAATAAAEAAAEAESGAAAARLTRGAGRAAAAAATGLASMAEDRGWGDAETGGGDPTAAPPETPIPGADGFALCVLTTLHLGQCRLSDGAAATIVEALCRPRSDICALMLPRNGVAARTTEALGALFVLQAAGGAESPRLRVLDLSWGLLRPGMGEYLAARLGGVQLDDLDLSRNAIGDAGGSAVLEAATGTTGRVGRLSLDGCMMTPAVSDAVCGALNRAARLVRLSLAGNALGIALCARARAVVSLRAMGARAVWPPRPPAIVAAAAAAAAEAALLGGGDRGGVLGATPGGPELLAAVAAAGLEVDDADEAATRRRARQVQHGGITTGGGRLEIALVLTGCAPTEAAGLIQTRAARAPGHVMDPPRNRDDLVPWAKAFATATAVRVQVDSNYDAALGHRSGDSAGEPRGGYAPGTAEGDRPPSSSAVLPDASTLYTASDAPTPSHSRPGSSMGLSALTRAPSRRESSRALFVSGEDDEPEDGVSTEVRLMRLKSNRDWAKQTTVKRGLKALETSYEQVAK